MIGFWIGFSMIFGLILERFLDRFWRGFWIDFGEVWERFLRHFRHNVCIFSHDFAYRLGRKLERRLDSFGICFWMTGSAYQAMDVSGVVR